MQMASAIQKGSLPGSASCWALALGSFLPVVPCQQGRPDHAGRSSEFGNHHFTGIERRWESAPAHFFDCGFENEIAGLHDVAAEHYQFNVEEIHHRRQRNAKKHSRPLHHHLGHLIALARGAGDVQRGEFPIARKREFRKRGRAVAVEPLSSPPHYVWTRGYGFKTPDVAAATLDTLRIDCHMAEFSREPGGASIDVSRDNQRGAYSRSQRDIEYIALAGGRPGLQLAVRRRIGVIVENNRETRSLRELGYQIDFGQIGQVRKDFNAVGPAVNKPRNAYTY